MARIVIVLKLEEKKEFDILRGFAQAIHDGFVALVAIYVSPTVTMLIFQSHIDALTSAISAWGPKGDRGAHSDHVAVVNAAEQVKNDLRQLKGYAETTTPDDEANFTLLGFETQLLGHQPPVGALPAPTNLRVDRTGPYIPGQIRYRWDKVNGARGYKIWTGTGALPPIPPDANLHFDNVTKTEFIVTGQPSGTALWIIVGCIGADGETGYAALAGQVMP